MNNTKFLVEIHRRGEHNDAIIQMITNHNEGKIELSFEVIKGYMMGKYCQYPTIIPDVRTIENIGSKSLEILEREKPTLSLSIVKVEVPEEITDELVKPI